MLTDREMALLVIAIYYAIKYNDSNPEVGMGSNSVVASKVYSRIPFMLTCAELQLAQEKAEEMLKK